MKAGKTVVFDSSIPALRNTFFKLDKNKDNMLDFQELQALHQFGLTPCPAWKSWFDAIDVDRRGCISFGGFLDLVSRVERSKGNDSLKVLRGAMTSEKNYRDNTSRTPLPMVARREDSVAKRIAGKIIKDPSRAELHDYEKLPRNTSNVDFTLDKNLEGIDWVSVAFHVYAGKESFMERERFVKLCRDLRLFDSKFSQDDAESAFEFRCLPGKDVLHLKAFRDVLVMIAKSKGLAPSVLLATVARRLHRNLNRIDSGVLPEVVPRRKTLNKRSFSLPLICSPVS